MVKRKPFRRIRSREEMEAKGRIKLPGYTGEYRESAYGKEPPRGFFSRLSGRFGNPKGGSSNRGKG